MKSYVVTLQLTIYVDDVKDDIDATFDAVKQVKEMNYGELASNMSLEEVLK